MKLNVLKRLASEVKHGSHRWPSKGKVICGNYVLNCLNIGFHILERRYDNKERTSSRHP